MTNVPELPPDEVLEPQVDTGEPEPEDEELVPASQVAFKLNEANTTWQGRIKTTLEATRFDVERESNGALTVNEQGRVVANPTAGQVQNPAYAQSAQPDTSFDEAVAEVAGYDPSTATLLKTLYAQNQTLMGHVQQLTQTVTGTVMPTVQNVALAGMTAGISDWNDIKGDVEARAKAVGVPMSELIGAPERLELFVDAVRAKRGAPAPVTDPNALNDRIADVAQVGSGSGAPAATGRNYGFSAEEIEAGARIGMTPEQMHKQLEAGKGVIER